MTTKAFIYADGKWQELKLYNIVEIDERLDEQLDSATMQVISKNGKAYADFSMVKIVQKDALLKEEKAYFYAFDTVEKRMGDYYIHSFELVEPSRRLMGIFIDGRAIVQPINGEKNSLHTELRRLLIAANLVTTEDTAVFMLVEGIDEKYDIRTHILLADTKAPEFYWQAQTSLWECLCDIGNVINCIPRLTANAEETAFDTIYFERVNDITAEYEI